jgi:hypothetical protein
MSGEGNRILAFVLFPFFPVLWKFPLLYSEVPKAQGQWRVFVIGPPSPKCFKARTAAAAGGAKARSSVELAPDSATAYNDLPWAYVTGPTNLRSPEKALPFALKAVELSKTHYELNTLVCTDSPDLHADRL